MHVKGSHTTGQYTVRNFSMESRYELSHPVGLPDG